MAMKTMLDALKQLNAKGATFAPQSLAERDRHESSGEQPALSSPYRLLDDDGSSCDQEPEFAEGDQVTGPDGDDTAKEKPNISPEPPHSTAAAGIESDSTESVPLDHLSLSESAAANQTIPMRELVSERPANTSEIEHESDGNDMTEVTPTADTLRSSERGSTSQMTDSKTVVFDNSDGIPSVSKALDFGHVESDAVADTLQVTPANFSDDLSTQDSGEPERGDQHPADDSQTVPPDHSFSSQLVNLPPTPLDADDVETSVSEEFGDEGTSDPEITEQPTAQVPTDKTTSIDPTIAWPTTDEDNDNDDAVDNPVTRMPAAKTVTFDRTVAWPPREKANHDVTEEATNTPSIDESVEAVSTTDEPVEARPSFDDSPSLAESDETTRFDSVSDNSIESSPNDDAPSTEDFAAEAPASADQAAAWTAPNDDYVFESGPDESIRTSPDYGGAEAQSNQDSSPNRAIPSDQDSASLPTDEVFDVPDVSDEPTGEPAADDRTLAANAVTALPESGSGFSAAASSQPIAHVGEAVSAVSDITLERTIVAVESGDQEPTQPVPAESEINPLSSASDGIVTEASTEAGAEVPSPSTPAQLTAEGTAYHLVLRANLADELLSSQYRDLLRRIVEELPHEPPAVILLIGADQEPHVSDVLAHMAELLVDRGAGEVLLVDANLPKRLLSKRFDVEKNPGLAEACESDTSWRDLLVVGEDPRLCILPGGGRLSPGKSRKGVVAPMIDQWKERFQIVLVDVGAPDAPLVETFAQSCDAIYLVVRLGQTDRKQVQAAIDTLHSLDGPLNGCIVTNTPPVTAQPKQEPA